MRVRLVSLEGLEEMPADTLEIVEGDEEGIERWNGWGPMEIARDSSGRVAGLKIRRCLRVYDENRRFSPLFDDDDCQTLECDTVLLAVGQSPALSFVEDGGADIEYARPGWPRIDPDTLATTAPGVFVAGDLAHGTRLLIDAVASGKAAARSVYRHVTGRSLHPDAVTAHLTLEGYSRERGYESIRRLPVPVAHPEERLQEPGRLVEIGYNADQAAREASRCLDCGVTPVFDGTRCVLCGGCVDVCPTLCLKLESLDALVPSSELSALTDQLLGPGADPSANSVILKDEDRCIRCALCAMRCPTDAIKMERVTFSNIWRSA
jgi:ferredoxin